MNSFAGIVVNHDHVYGVKMIEQNDVFTVVKKQKMTRTDSVAKDVSNMTKELNGVDTAFGIVGVVRPKIKVVTTTTDLDEFDVKASIDDHDEEFLAADPVEYYH